MTTYYTLCFLPHGGEASFWVMYVPGRMPFCFCAFSLTGFATPWHPHRTPQDTTDSKDGAGRRLSVTKISHVNANAHKLGDYQIHESDLVIAFPKPGMLSHVRLVSRTRLCRH